MERIKRYWEGIKKRKWLFFFSLCFLVWYYFSLPRQLFQDPYCTVLQSKENELLSASIAADGQWRFPPIDSVPSKFTKCLIAFEDKRFYQHPGVDLLSMAKALEQNMRAGEIIRGGSTISMQVIRLSRKGRNRTVLEKIYEMILATRLEFRYSKDEILALYSSHAPFGGNVVGIEAGCWRYFGRDTKELSWGEAAFLAVLPNAPSLVHPGKNRQVLLEKRNRLLDVLQVNGQIDQFTCGLAKEETIPDQPHSLPRLARHLLMRVNSEGRGRQKVISTLDYALQERVEEILSRHHLRLAGNEIHNGAAIIAEVTTGNVLAYAGNISAFTSEGGDVDIITSPRSTGSILKPILYAAALDEGKILRGTLLPDVPAFINGFTPKNFSHDYDGAINADQALVRSLNIPAVFLLKDYRYEKFHTLLRNAGITTLNKSPDHYGLSLILGGAEGTLWDIAGVYASMARTLNNYFEYPGKNRYSKGDFHSLNYLAGYSRERGASEASSWINASSIFQTFDVLQELHRPGEESGWKHFESSRNIAWKTGTSFGFRDAWAVGVTPDYVIGVWIGNADGEGRPGLTGIDAAAPVMFDIFSSIKGSNHWFNRPHMEMVKATVCKSSGMRNNESCLVVDTLWMDERGLATLPCTYHKKLHLSADERFQVNTQCAAISDIHEKSWFVLPPVQEYYYRSKNLSYKNPPPFRPDCWGSVNSRMMDLVYPKPGARLFIPRDHSGSAGGAVFQLAHRNSGSVVYWYLDGNYMGSTENHHQLAVMPPSGKHRLTLIDESGETLEESFEVLSDL
jgi:penicillin-binding protein 1C